MLPTRCHHPLVGLLLALLALASMKARFAWSRPLPWAPQAKDKLLELMSAQIAGEQEAALKRVLGEDEAVMKRREALTHKLDMLRRAQAELTSVDV